MQLKKTTQKLKKKINQRPQHSLKRKFSVKSNLKMLLNPYLVTSKIKMIREMLEETTGTPQNSE